MFQIQNPSNGIKFNVRIVRQGERYGLHDCKTHDKADLLVEFYDARYTDDQYEPNAEIRARGQFVSRYYASTLLGECKWSSGNLGKTGLDLQGDVPAWKVDAEAIQRVLDYVRGFREADAARATLREALADGVDAVQYALAQFRQQGTQWWVEGEAFLDKAKALGLANVTEV